MVQAKTLTPAPYSRPGYGETKHSSAITLPAFVPVEWLRSSSRGHQRQPPKINCLTKHVRSGAMTTAATVIFNQFLWGSISPLPIICEQKLIGHRLDRTSAVDEKRWFQEDLISASTCLSLRHYFGSPTITLTPKFRWEESSGIKKKLKRHLCRLVSSQSTKSRFQRHCWRNAKGNFETIKTYTLGVVLLPYRVARDGA